MTAWAKSSLCPDSYVFIMGIRGVCQEIDCGTGRDMTDEQTGYVEDIDVYREHMSHYSDERRRQICALLALQEAGKEAPRA